MKPRPKPHPVRAMREAVEAMTVARARINPEHDALRQWRVSAYHRGGLSAAVIARLESPRRMGKP